MNCDEGQNRGSLVRRGAHVTVNWRTTLSIIQHHILLTLLQNCAPFFRGRLLDVGCGERAYEFVYGSQVSASYGVDLPGSLHQCDTNALASAESIPFRDATFDTVLCTEVLEHVENPDAVLEETHRVLRDDGHVIVSIPFMYPLHEQPKDYRRYSYFGLIALLEKHGFQPVSVRAKGGAITTMVVLFFLGLTGALKETCRRLFNVDVLGNPVVRLCVVVPQWLYLFCFKFFLGRTLEPEKRTVSKYERAMSLGYLCVARRLGSER